MPSLMAWRNDGVESRRTTSTPCAASAGSEPGSTVNSAGKKSGPPPSETHKVAVGLPPRTTIAGGGAVQAAMAFLILKS